MNIKKNVLPLSIALAIFIGSFYLYAKWSKTSFIDMKRVSTELNVSSKQLVANYLNDETHADSVFSGKIIEVIGLVKEVTFLNNRNTVILYGENSSSGIICDFDDKQIEEIKKISKNDTVMIKGVCKGFLKDVILLNCLLMNSTTPNE
jgi:hypothetical protein